jgi:hypothetical protein
MFDKGNASLRTDRWRYIRYGDGSEELYDHSNDPNEWSNLANKNEFDVQRQLLRKQLDERLSRKSK